MTEGTGGPAIKVVRFLAGDDSLADELRGRWLAALAQDGSAAAQGGTADAGGGTARRRCRAGRDRRGVA